MPFKIFYEHEHTVNDIAVTDTCMSNRLYMQKSVHIWQETWNLLSPKLVHVCLEAWHLFSSKFMQGTKFKAYSHEAWSLFSSKDMDAKPILIKIRTYVIWSLKLMLTKISLCMTSSFEPFFTKISSCLTWDIQYRVFSIPGVHLY